MLIGYFRDRRISIQIHTDVVSSYVTIIVMLTDKDIRLSCQVKLYIVQVYNIVYIFKSFIFVESFVQIGSKFKMLSPSLAAFRVLFACLTCISVLIIILYLFI